MNSIVRESEIRSAYQTHTVCITPYNETKQYHPVKKKKKLESIPDKEGAHLKAQNRGRRSRTIRAPIHIACRPKFSLAGMPDNGPNAGACGGDIMRVN